MAAWTFVMVFALVGGCVTVFLVVLDAAAGARDRDEEA